MRPTTSSAPWPPRSAAACRSTSSRATGTSSRLVDDANQVRVIYTARGGVRSPTSSTRPSWPRSTASAPDRRTATWRSFAVTRATVCRASRASARRPRPRLITTYGTLAAIRAAIDDGDPAIKGAQRARLEAAGDYLDAAPRVVAVAKDAAVPDIDLAAPSAVADPALMSRLAVEHGLTSSFDRVISALGID